MTDHPSRTSLIGQLRSITFLKRLDQPTLDALAQGALWREYAAGEVVFVEGESSSGLYVLHAGWLKVLKTSVEGREQVLRFIGPGETFNEIGVFADRPNPATAVALEATGVWLLQRQAVLELLRTRPDFAQHVIENMADRVIDLVTLVADLSLRPVTARLARLLLEDATGDVLHRPRWYTQTELAARLGTVPDVVQRALRTLEGDGVLEVERHVIRIRDRTALERLAM